MNKTIAMAAALLAVGAAQAQTAPQVPVQDRIAELCAVSNTDLEGQRLAKACRAEVRAQYEARQTAARSERTIRTAANDAARPR